MRGWAGRGRGRGCLGQPKEDGGSSGASDLLATPSLGCPLTVSSRVWNPSLSSFSDPTLGISLVEILLWLDYQILTFPEFCLALLLHAVATFSQGDCIQTCGFPLSASCFGKEESERKEGGRKGRRQEERKEWGKGFWKALPPEYCCISISLILPYSDFLEI